VAAPASWSASSSASEATFAAPSVWLEAFVTIVELELIVSLFSASTVTEGTTSVVGVPLDVSTIVEPPAEIDVGSTRPFGR